MPIFVPLICLLGMGLAVFGRSAQAAAADLAALDDVPMRLLRWAAGMLPAQRAEWGQAMLGELDHIDGRGRRWRFAVGCAGAALLMPPCGRAAAAVWALMAVAAGGAVVVAGVGARYGLGAGDWVFAAIALLLLVSYALYASVLLRQRGVTLPGLLGGLLIALSWLALSGYTFYGVIAPRTSIWVTLVPVIAMPLLLGAAGTLWSGSAAAGRRIARLAAVSAGLGLFLYATIAVAALGLGGPPGDPGCTGSCNIGDRLGTNTIFFLWLLPLTAAALGWAAAAGTARIRPRLAASAVAVPRTAVRSRHGTAYVVLLCAVVAVAGFLIALGFRRA